MVMILAIASPRDDRRVLRRILKKGRYATLDLKAEAGADYPEEVIIIRRIFEGMVSSRHYPPSPMAQNLRHEGEVASWENEGGSTDTKG